MMIPGDARITGTAGLQRAYSVKSRSTAKTGKGEFARRFDSFSISESSTADTYALDLKSKLTQEVRTATSSEQIAAIREQIQSGSYQIDAREIAKKMLLMG